MTKKNNSSGKPVAIVTGGTKGIGAACCRMLAAQGFYVGIVHRGNQEKGLKLLSEPKMDGFLVKADLSNIDQVEEMVKQIKTTAGRVDVLVNNAGISINNHIVSMKIEEFDAQRALMRGVWYLVKRILRLFMLRQSNGRIINISSVTAYTGNSGQIPYTMEKGALDAMTKSLAKELAGRNILVNSVAPGFINTDMTQTLPEEVKENIIANIPLQRIGNVDEVAEVVAFLASKGSYINGSVLHVNGGMYAG
jgi:3-oxoacyl-[acyl-carrier protein] reductase